MVRQVLDALAAAHQAGIVHRDLKPGNVVLAEDKDGGTRAVVTDFGLARAEGLDAGHLTLTTAGVLGTPAYLAPEQVQGGQVTPAVDIYALGIVLYETLTGKVPFVGDSALSTAVKRLQEAPAPPRVHAPGLDSRWEAVILRCLERDPAARYPSARAVARALAGDGEAALPADGGRRGARAEQHAAADAGGAAQHPARRRRATGPEAKRRRLAVVALSLVILASFGVTAWRVQERLAEQREKDRLLALPGVADVVPRRAVAVLGFKNSSQAGDAAWLSGALTEMLSTELGAASELRVVASENVARTKVELGLADAETLGAETLARLRTALGADHVLLGSYLAIGDREGERQLRLDLRLQSTATGETKPIAESGGEAQLFTLVARAGERLRRALGAGGDRTAGAAEAARAALPSNPLAARFYAEGLAKLRGFEPLAARDLFQQAVAADRRNPLAHSGLAAAWTALGFQDRAATAARTAFELSRPLPQEQRLVVEAQYRETVEQWPRAVTIYRTLWGLYPDNVDYGLRLGAAQTAGGTPQEAIATFAALRGLPKPAGEDPRIDLAEATAAGALGDLRRQQRSSARAAAKGAAIGARLLVAQARLAECRAWRNLGDGARGATACEQARALFARAGDRAGGAEALTHAANLRFDRGDLEGAKALYEEALATYRAIGAKAAEAGALNNIAVVLKAQGQGAEAERLYRQVLALARETGNRSAQAYALNNLGAALARRGNLAAAARMFEQSLALRRALGDRMGEAAALDNLGAMLRKQGALPAARRRHEQALSLRRQAGQRLGEVGSLNNLGQALLDQGELTAAEGRFAESRALCRKIDNRSAAAYAEFGLGEVMARRGDLQAARRRHEEALALRERLGERGTAAESRVALATVLRELGELERAEALAREAAEAFAAEGAADGQALALAVAARSAIARGDEDAARDLLAQARELLARTENLRIRLLVLLTAARFEAASRPAEAARLCEEVRTAAQRAGILELELESRLALAELAPDARAAAAHRTDLEALAATAEAMGFRRLAEQARRLAAGTPQQATTR
jgi:tetratricopeptide (TPR) repeat protein